MTPSTALLLARFRALGDLTRLRLLALCGQGECSVSELTAVLGQSQPRVSQHLKPLVEAGLLERFRDGKRVYYRVPAVPRGTLRQLLELLPEDEPVIAADAAALRRLRGGDSAPAELATEAVPLDRSLHRALLELTITAPLGDLLDIGCGSGRLLKLLASRSHRAVGVDIDPGARRLARAEVLLAGLPNASLRAGDMYRLPFADGEFDTVLLDGVLASAARPVDALAEARRLLAPGGRLVIVEELPGRADPALEASLAAWSAAAGLRLGRPRRLPEAEPRWALAVALSAGPQSAAA